MSSRGRRPKINQNTLVNVCLKYKDSIIHKINRIASKNAPIWDKLANELGGGGYKPKSLHAIITCNRHGIRDKLMGQCSIPPSEQMANINDTTSVKKGCVKTEVFQGTSAVKCKLETGDDDTEKICLNQDPLKVLEIMKSGSLKTIIHNIGLNPFYVQYWSKHQLDVYKMYATDDTTRMYIATSINKINRIRRIANSESGEIFLYNCIIDSEKNGSFPVSQMLSETHNVNILCYWLMEWMENVASPPREIVCNFHSPILTAAVQTFAGYFSLENYADAFIEGNLPVCYIRIDAAHFISRYDDFLTNFESSTKEFLLSMLGKLILCKNIERAEKVLRVIFIIARSNGSKKIRGLSKDREKNNNFNKWSQWGKNIDNEVCNLLYESEEGAKINEYCTPEFINYLLEDIKWFPLWSNVYRDKFGFGKIPANCASENYFHQIQNIMLDMAKETIPVHEFVMKHVHFIDGDANISKTTLTNVSKEITFGSCSKQVGKIIGLNQKEQVPSSCKNGLYPPADQNRCYKCKRLLTAFEVNEVNPSPFEDEGYEEPQICVHCWKSTKNFEENETFQDLENVEISMEYVEKEFVNNEAECVEEIEQNAETNNVEYSKESAAYPISLNTIITTNDDTTELCHICKKASIEYCSSPFEKERLRICVECHKINDFGIFTGTKAIEEDEKFEVEKFEESMIYLCEGQLQGYTYLRGVSQCTASCSPTETALLPRIELKLLLEGNGEEMERSIRMQEMRSCREPGCIGIESLTICDAGPFITMHVISYSEHSQGVQLKEIPKEIKLPFMEEPYSIFSIVPISSNSAKQAEICRGEDEYFTVISYQGHSWTQKSYIDDTETAVDENYLVCPQAITYATKRPLRIT